MSEPFTRQPLLEHLVELKKRVIITVLFFMGAFAVSYGFASDIFAFLIKPLSVALDGEQRAMQFTSLTGGFFTRMKLGYFAAVFLTIPMAATQLYYFLSPGLYRKERLFLIPFLIAAPILFVAGASIFYYFIMPMAWKFLLSFELHGGDLPVYYQGKIDEYLSLVIDFMLCFGLSFQTPIVIIILAKLGLVTPEFLARNRRYAVVVIVILAAIFSPADIVSHVSLSLMLYALYEIGIFGGRMVTKPQPNDLAGAQS